MASAAPNPLLAKIAAYAQLLAADPSSNIFVSLSEAQRKIGQLDEAFHVVSKGLISHPNNAPGHVVLARILCQQNNLAASIESFLRALELEPNNLAGLVGCARVYLLQEQFSAARNLLIRARDLSPADPVINKLLLSLPEPEITPETGQNQTSVANLQPVSHSTAESRVPEAASLSSVHEEEAREEASLEASSVSSLETVTLAELYMQQGLASKALQIYRKLLSRDPDNLDLRRRIRELENSFAIELETQPVSSAPTATETESDATTEILPQTKTAPLLVSEPEPEPEPLAALTLPDELLPRQIFTVGENTVLEQLNRLLTSIQKRRGDVQGNA